MMGVSCAITNEIKRKNKALARIHPDKPEDVVIPLCLAGSRNLTPVLY